MNWKKIKQLNFGIRFMEKKVMIMKQKWLSVKKMRWKRK